MVSLVLNMIFWKDGISIANEMDGLAYASLATNAQVLKRFSHEKKKQQDG
jgi:hypothetical protein